MNIILISPLAKTISKQFIERIITIGNYDAIESKYPEHTVLLYSDCFMVVDNNILKKRLSVKDRPYEFQTYPEKYVYENTILRKTTDLHGNEIYSFGNLFGSTSVILGEKFKTFLDSEYFEKMLNQKLKNVYFVYLSGQYELKNYELRK
jgi:hypothetical protein